MKFNRLIPVLVVMNLVLCSPRAKSGPGDSSYQMQVTARYSLAVPEPSDLCWHIDQNYLWTVSDQTNRVYLISRQGEVIKMLDWQGDDLEGIALRLSDTTLWVAEERLRDIVQLDTIGHELARFHLDLTGAANSGLEGICISADGVFFVLNEKNPGLLVKLNSDFSINRKIALDKALDYSGITYDPMLDCFWIISDESALLFRWSEHEGIGVEYSLPDHKMEGLVINAESGAFLLVNDQSEELIECRRIDSK